MRHGTAPLFLLLLTLGAVCQTSEAANLTADQAKNHIGEKATVCGVVTAARYRIVLEGGPTFVYLDDPSPNNPFRIVIWGKDLIEFYPRPTTWVGKPVCVTGLIDSLVGSPIIVAKSAKQIKVEESK